MICGMAGPAGFNPAFSRLWRSGGHGPAGARCVHEGAVTRVTLADVRVEQAEKGVWVHHHGLADATRVVVKGCLAGFTELCHGVRSVWRECKAVGCDFLAEVTSLSDPSRPLTSAMVDNEPEPMGFPMPEIEILRA